MPTSGTSSRSETISCSHQAEFVGPSETCTMTGSSTSAGAAARSATPSRSNADSTSRNGACSGPTDSMTCRAATA
jgi:hypothetical protein